MFLGHFPIPSVDDPKSLGLNSFYEIVMYGGYVCLVNIPVWIGLFVTSIKRRRVAKAGLMIFVAGITLIVLQIFVDPFDIVNWYLD
jgi:hypothetical protein